MHGGLFSSDDVTLDDIRGIDRNRQPPEEGTTACCNYVNIPLPYFLNIHVVHVLLTNTFCSVS